MSIIEFENVHYTYPGDSRESLSGVTLSMAEKYRFQEQPEISRLPFSDNAASYRVR